MLLMYGTSHLTARGTYGLLKTAVSAPTGRRSPDAPYLVAVFQAWESFLEKLGEKKKLLEECARSIQQPGLDQWEIYQKVLHAMDAVYSWEHLIDYQVFVFVVTGRMVDLHTLADDRERFKENSLEGCFKRYFEGGSDGKD
jgi:hypothetical protein